MDYHCFLFAYLYVIQKKNPGRQSPEKIFIFAFILVGVFASRALVVRRERIRVYVQILYKIQAKLRAVSKPILYNVIKDGNSLLFE